jgi:hypothetical protein
MNDSKIRTESDISLSIWDKVRQLCYAPEFRISAPASPAALEAGQLEVSGVVEGGHRQNDRREATTTNQVLIELATCLWYLKTKYFKRPWPETDISDDDPRIRRALTRLNKSILVLAESGVEVHDPIKERYPYGGTSTMRLIEHLPTAGVTVEQVSETIAPMIHRNSRLIQRAEVFVSIPKDGPTQNPCRETAGTDDIEG